MRRLRVVDVLAAALSVSALVWSCWPEDDKFRLVAEGPTPTMRAAVGCWRFERGSEYLDNRVPNGSVVVLNTVTDPQEERPDRYLLSVLPLDSANVRSVRLSGWGASAGDDKRILIFLGDGFTGVALRLRLRDSLLTGTARRYTDAFPSFSFRHAVRARKVDCPTRGPA